MAGNNEDSQESGPSSVSAALSAGLRSPPGQSEAVPGPGKKANLACLLACDGSLIIIVCYNSERALQL